MQTEFDIANPTLWVVPMTALIYGFSLLEKFGRRLSRDLAAAGHPTNRRAPMHRDDLFVKWLKKNSLTPEIIEAVGSATYRQRD
jgi:hypothetical protein